MSSFKLGGWILEAVRSWAFSVCAAMAVCGIVLQLAPKSNLSGILKLAVSTFFLCCLLSPIIIRFPAQRAELEEYSASLMKEKEERLNQVMESQAQMAAKRGAEKNIEDKLRQMGINYHSVTINISTNGQSETASEARIILDPSYEAEHEKISAMLESALEMRVRLVYAEGE